MSESINTRQILPSTVSSLASTGPASPSRSRVSVACESCKRRKCKCRGGHPCDACAASNINCVFDETQDKRRKVATKRAIEELNSHKEILQGLLKAIRSGNDEHVLDQIRQHASLTEIALTLKDELSTPEPVDEFESAEAEADNSQFESPTLPEGSEPRGPRRSVHSPSHGSDAMFRFDISQTGQADSGQQSGEDGDTKLTQELEHYKNTVINLLNGTDQEADEILQRLRSSLGRSDAHRASLPPRQDDPLRYGAARTLPDISSRVNASNDSAQQSTLWYPLMETESSNDSYLPYPAKSSHLAPKSPEDSSAKTPARGITATSPSFPSGSVTDMSRYITSTERRQKESEKSANRANTRPT